MDFDRHNRADCTWSKTRGGFNDLPLGVPGPGTYDFLNMTESLNLNRSRAMEPGFTFPAGSRDALKPDTAKNVDLGPGSHDPRLLKSGTSRRFLGGSLGVKPLVDNGVPGPGTYEPEPIESIPSFKIAKKTELNDKQRFKLIEQEGKIPVGPQSYNPTAPVDPKAGIRFRMAERREENTTNRHSPAPNRYQLLGDFDFRDPTKPDEKVGKLPKFAFGIKPVVKPKNLDVPGPAEYNVDRQPMNYKNISYWIGTEVRRDLSIPYSHLYPGPGHYDHEQPVPGPYPS